MALKIRTLLVCGAAFAAFPYAANAIAQTRSIDIPAEDAAKSIPDFARQEGVQISAPVGHLRGVKTPSVSGAYDLSTALHTLIDGTGLEVASNDGSTIVLRRKTITSADQVASPAARVAAAARPPIIVKAAAPEEALAGTPETVTVTGTRILSNGNDLPTPVTVVSAEQLQATTPSNIPDGLNKLPAFASAQTSNSAPNGGNGKGSVPTGNFLDLRGMGPIRTLVLEEGHRVPGTFFDTTVDTNMLPQMLIQRVDVVTGGASAVYGSDAVSGVVNFILDKKFEGFKGVFQGGISTYGDVKSFRIGLAGGEDILKGHLIWSLEYYNRDSIPNTADRPYGSLASNVVGSGTTARPYVFITNARRSNLAFGGLVATGPFAGQQFAPDGTLVPFNPGTTTYAGNNVSIGGDGGVGRNLTLLPVLNTGQGFARWSYNLTDDITGYFQAGYALARTYSANQAIPLYASGVPLTIYSGNAFLKPQYQSILTSTKTPSFQESLFSVAINTRLGLTYQTGAATFSTGLAGTIFNDYHWDLYYGHGDTRTIETTRNNINTGRLYAALDAVKDPTSGQTVCNVSLTAPGAYPGCVPLNIFGVGAETPAALDYISGTTSWTARNELDDFAANLTGKLFDGWAGPINMAVGLEYRLLGLTVTSSNPVNTFNNQYLRTGLDGHTVASTILGWVKEVQSPGKGAESVYEGDIEFNVPLVKNLPLIELLTVDGAYRYTQYSISGSSNTWKIGLEWQMLDDLRVRATRSRDFRAPTLWDLFQQPVVSSSLYSDVLTGVTNSGSTIAGGNPNLKPEVASNTTAGAVYTPSWAPGLSFSADYFHIEISNAIGVVDGKDPSVQSLCIKSGGTSPACALVVRPFPITNTTIANAPTLFYAQNENLARIYSEGVDFEVNYGTDLADVSDALTGYLHLRGLWTHQPTLKNQTIPGANILNIAGTAQAPSDRATFTVDYKVGNLAVDVLERYLSSFHQALDKTLIYNIPNVQPYLQTDVNVAYDFVAVEVPMTGFASIDNLFDTRGGLYLPAGTSVGGYYPAAPGTDIIGRYFTVGFKFKM